MLENINCGYRAIVMTVGNSDEGVMLSSSLLEKKI